MEESLSQGRGTEDAATDGTCRLAEDGDVRRVTAEVADVALYPLEGKDLVKQTVVAGVSALRLLCQLGVSHKA